MLDEKWIRKTAEEKSPLVDKAAAAAFLRERGFESPEEVAKTIANYYLKNLKG